MVVYSSPAASFVFFNLPSSTRCYSSNIKLPRAKITPFCCADLKYDNSSPARVNPESPKRSNGEQLAPDSTCSSILCSCTRRRFTEAAAATALFPICPSNASNLQSDYMVRLLSVSIVSKMLCFQFDLRKHKLNCCINCGSSQLKFVCVDCAEKGSPSETRLVRGVIRIGYGYKHEAL